MLILLSSVSSGRVSLNYYCIHNSPRRILSLFACDFDMYAIDSKQLRDNNELI